MLQSMVNIMDTFIDVEYWNNTMTWFNRKQGIDNNFKNYYYFDSYQRNENNQNKLRKKSWYKF